MNNGDTTNLAAGDEWLSAAEAARLIPGGVHVRTLYRWVQQGKVPYVKLPSGVRRFRKSDIDALSTPVEIREGAAIAESEISESSSFAQFARAEDRGVENVR